MEGLAVQAAGRAVILAGSLRIGRPGMIALGSVALLAGSIRLLRKNS